MIVYLEALQKWSEAPPIKNNLQALVIALRQKHPGCRVFISNLLPTVRKSPVGLSVEKFNFILIQAIRSTNRAEGKVHVLSVFEHFVSTKKQKLIKPVDAYFKQNEHLTQLGCLMLRECFLREAGLKPYWFAKEESRSEEVM